VSFDGGRSGSSNTALHDGVQFGDGEIIDIDGLAGSVKFDNGAVKKLNVEYVRLEKL